MSAIGKGDVRLQRQRRRDRYRGCRICGEPNAKWCADCRAVETVLTAHWAPNLSLFVDGGFVTARGGRERPRIHSKRYAPLKARIEQDHPDWNAHRVEIALIEALVSTGVCVNDDPGHGGAGLVLVSSTGEILATRSCGFPARCSSDAELHAVIRGARWAPDVVIYTDSESTCRAAISSNAKLDVRFLCEHDRGPAHALAHQLSVEGRLLQASRVFKEQS